MPNDIKCPHCGGKESDCISACKWCYDEFCANDKCPYCADFCPVTENPEVCKFAEEGVDNG